MKTNNFINGAAITLLIFATSCSKESKEDVNIIESAFETKASIYSDELEKSGDAVTFQTDNFSNNQNISANYQLPECATLSVNFPEGSNFPKVITIDYGSENCLVRPHLYKRGKVLITISDSIININAIRTITFDSLYINDNLVSGEMILTNLGENEDGYITFDIDNDFTVGDWNRQTNGSKIWIEGLGMNGYEDNIFLLTGSSVTTSANGVTISRTIQEDLRVDRSCGYIIEGIVVVQWDENTASIDYGDGSCDSQATITQNGQVFDIDLNDFNYRRRLHSGQ
jgi:hypothetical protein